MSHLYKLDEDKNAVAVDDAIEWAQWFEAADRVVGRTEINDFVVSTVFLGIDHSFGTQDDQGNPKLILFETMIYRKAQDGDVEWLDGALRYEKFDHAERGHADVVSGVRAKLQKGELLE